MKNAVMETTTILEMGEGTALDALGPKIEPLTLYEEDAYRAVKVTLPPGVCVPLHSHGDTQSFYVLSGEAQVLVQKDAGLWWQTLRRGEFIQISGGTKQAWRNVSHEPMEAFVTAAERPLAELSERYGYWIGSPEENAEVGISLIQ